MFLFVLWFLNLSSYSFIWFNYICVEFKSTAGCGNLFERQLTALLRKRKYFVRFLFRNYIAFIWCMPLLPSVSMFFCTNAVYFTFGYGMVLNNSSKTVEGERKLEKKNCSHVDISSDIGQNFSSNSFSIVHRILLVLLTLLRNSRQW